jgi:hypothetical protein
MGDRSKQASAQLDKLEEQVKSGVMSLSYALTCAFAQGAEFQTETHRLLEEASFERAKHQAS